MHSDINLCETAGLTASADNNITRDINLLFRSSANIFTDVKIMAAVYTAL